MKKFTNYLNEFIARVLESIAEKIIVIRTDELADLDARILRSAAKIVRNSRHLQSPSKENQR